jgi:hypothetical protein
MTECKQETFSFAAYFSRRVREHLLAALDIQKQANLFSSEQSED